ncbi:hypothetical protein PENSPDRAFT_664281 [Peniophora sp. CONT]|nr:hypothetical protein PENSPDRAFT_664281 [Peniophora sp. CONT]
MLSLLSRTTFSAVSAARAASAVSATCFRSYATAATPNVTGSGKLARRAGSPTNWLTLDAAVASRTAKQSEEKQKKIGPTTVAESWADMSDKAVARLGPPLGKYAGRSVEVQRQDLATALRRLNTILFENRVHAERVRNLRHEKKGYKRRRLASERWRRRFAHEACHMHRVVRTKVELVKTIRRRGA